MSSLIVLCLYYHGNVFNKPLHSNGCLQVLLMREVPTSPLPIMLMDFGEYNDTKISESMLKPR